MRGAREELQALQEERTRTDRLKASVQKELENARDKAGKIEQVRGVWWHEGLLGWGFLSTSLA